MKLKKIKYLLKCLIGKDLWLRRETINKVEFLGSEYGGWGLNLTDLSENSVVYSCGIGEDASFDLALIDAVGCDVLALDPTPKSIQWVKDNISDTRFRMYPWAMSENEEPLKLWLPDNPDHVSASFAESDKKTKKSFVAEAKTLAGLMDHFGHTKVDVLKMDIEGSEYGVLRQICKDGSIEKVGQILVEFHHWQETFTHQHTLDALRLLTDSKFGIDWVSDSGHEVLFSKR